MNKQRDLSKIRGNPSFEKIINSSSIFIGHVVQYEKSIYINCDITDTNERKQYKTYLAKQYTRAWKRYDFKLSN